MVGELVGETPEKAFFVFDLAVARLEKFEAALQVHDFLLSVRYA